MLGALRGVSSLLTRRRPTHQHPQVLVVINAGGLHVYRLGPSPVLISTFNFDTLVSWQSMNDMLIINIIYATKHDHNKRRASAPLQFALPARHLDPTPRPPSCAIRQLPYFLDINGGVGTAFYEVALGLHWRNRSTA